MDHQLFVQLAVASGMVVGTVVVHLVGLGVLLALLRNHNARFRTARERLNQLAAVVGVAIGLFALHSIEIWAYAALFAAVGATRGFEEALYFSTVSYTTVGYGDVVLAKPWRLVGAIESANGIILLGWSTAFFVTVVARIRALEHDWTDGDPRT